MKICVTGSFGNQDIGDDAMLEMHLRNLDGMGIDRDDVTLIGHQRKYTSEYFRHPIERCVSSRKAKNLAKGHDCLIVTGGGTVNSRDRRGGSLMRMSKLMQPFIAKGLPIFMSGQTIGPLGKYPRHDEIACHLVDHVDVLTVRDRGRSKRYLDMIGAKPKELIETIDDAACLPYEDEPLPEEIRNFGVSIDDVIAVNVTDYTRGPCFVGLVEALAEKGWSVLLVSHHPNDYRCLKDMETPETSNRGQVKAWDNCWATSKIRAGTLKRAINQCNMAIGGRYHFLVFALSGGTPCIGMAGNEYSYQKQMGFAEQIGWGGYVIDDLRIEKILELLELLNVCFDVDEEPDPVPEPVSFDRLRSWLKGL